MENKIYSNKDKDLVLVRRLKRGDYKAFDLLLLKYQSRVVGLALKFVKDLQIAEDIAQESFLKAYKSINSFREESAFYTWIYRITVNTSKNYLTSKSRKKELSESDIKRLEDSEDIFDIPGGSSPEEILSANNLREVIMESLTNLPEDIRTAISLREFEGLTYEEISEVLNCPIGTVRSRIFRGREIMQERISPILNEDKKLNKSSK
ncbi:MAG: RNA polymerase sigma factor RpoE [Gammaproteobacteria bacterium]|nr:RNA polymerase sigma factor RpoE [Gammaproteobacteria bacterium]|tara:strand:- start:117 stop:737 length:621 start_codon:yes stop_codon:yes gene_type:complete